MKLKNLAILLLFPMTSVPILAQEKNQPASSVEKFFDGTDEQTEELMAEAQKNIERIRKGDFVLHLKDSDGKAFKGKVEISLKEHEFSFGSNVGGFNRIPDTDPGKIAALKAIDEIFNTVHVTDYWGSNQPSRDAIHNWSVADYQLNLAREYGWKPRFHAIVYGYPEWMKQVETEEECWKIIEKRIRSVAERYGGEIEEFDVMNEMIYQHFMTSLKAHWIIMESKAPILWEPEVGHRIIKYAREQLPDAKLVLLETNSFKLMWNLKNPHFQELVEYHKKLIEWDTPYDYIGFQGHFYTTTDTERGLPFHEGTVEYGPRTFMMDGVFEGLDYIAKLGKPIVITEFNAPSRNLFFKDDQPGLSEEEVAAWTVNFFTVAFSKPYIKEITMWFSIDNVMGRGMDAGVVTQKGEFKPTFYALKKLLRETWHTEWNGTVRKGKADFRGFYGTYTVKAEDCQPVNVVLTKDNSDQEIILRK